MCISKLRNALAGAPVRRGFLPLTLLFLIIEFYDELHFGVQGAALPALRGDLGLSYDQVGLLLGIPAITGAVLELVVMLLGDTSLRKRLMVGGGIIMATATIMMALAQSFGPLLLAFVVIFPASGAFVTLSQATLMDLNPGRQAQMMARWTVFGSLGNLIGPAILAGLFAVGFSWRFPYALLALLGLLLALWLTSQALPDRTIQNPDPTMELSDGSSGASSGLARPPDLVQVLKGLLPIFRNLRLLRWFVLLDLSDLLLDIYMGYAALYFADIVQLNAAQVSLVIGAMMGAGLLSNLALVPLLERFPGRPLVRLSATVTAVLYILWLAIPGMWIKIGLAVLIRLTTLGWYEVLMAEAYAALPGRSATVMAVNSLFGILGGSLAWLIGAFAAKAGLPAAMWLLLVGPLSLILFVPKR